MENKIEFFSSPDFRISYSDTRIDQATSIHHYHDSYEIALYEKADLRIFIKDYEYRINDGDVFFINEYDIHHIMYNATPHYIRYVVHFKKDYLLPLLRATNMEGLFDQLYSVPYRKIRPNIRNRSELQSYFEAIYRATGYGHEPFDDTSRAQVLSNLLLLLIRLHELFMAETPTQKLSKGTNMIQNVVRHIDQNYMTPINLDQLSSSFYTSKYYLCHLFRKKTGLSVTEYIQYRRVIEAQKLLKETDRDITSIYYDCGFNNAQHFYRVFQKFSRVTPLQYRKMYRNK
ncbi:MAG TPA: AraC family transcriptional regulator [Thermoclostridium sp.]